MNNAHAQGGWTIAEVERLTGLPRRDIQRCCYSEKGGLGILNPLDSAWGRRAYSTSDIATLFVVRLEKNAGLSLPEVAEKLRKHAALGSGEKPGMLAVHIARLAERQEEVEGQLLAARAFLMAAQGEEPPLVGELVEREIDKQLIAAFRKTEDENVTQTNPNEPKRSKSQLAPNQDGNRVANRGWLVRCFSPLAGIACHSPEASVPVAKALADAIDSIHERYRVSHITAKQAFTWALNAPGMPSAIEMWLGPATFKLLMRALR